MMSQSVLALSSATIRLTMFGVLLSLASVLTLAFNAFVVPVLWTFLGF